MNITTLLILVLIGLLAGVISGMVGVGGGIIIVPGLVFLLGMTQHGAQGTSLALMLPPIGIMAAYNYHKAGHLNWKYAAIIAVAFVVGGYFGSKWTVTYFDEKTLKKIFGGMMLLAGVKMIFFSK